MKGKVINRVFLFFLISVQTWRWVEWRKKTETKVSTFHKWWLLLLAFGGVSRAGGWWSGPCLGAGLGMGSPLAQLSASASSFVCLACSAYSFHVWNQCWTRTVGFQLFSIESFLQMKCLWKPSIAKQNWSLILFLSHYGPPGSKALRTCHVQPLLYPLTSPAGPGAWAVTSLQTPLLAWERHRSIKEASAGRALVLRRAAAVRVCWAAGHQVCSVRRALLHPRTPQSWIVFVLKVSGNKDVPPVGRPLTVFRE